jgi:PAS domain S-box-containing protein
MTKAHRRKKESGSKTKPADHSKRSPSPGIKDPNVKNLTNSLMRGHADVPDLLVILDCNGVILEANPAVCSSLGLSRKSLLGRCVWDLLPDKVIQRRRAALEEAVKTSKVVRFEDERKGRFFDHVIYPVVDSDHPKNKFVAIARDITEYIKAREELSESRERYRLVLERTSDMVSITTFSERPTYVYVNPAHSSVLHYKPEDLIGKCPFDFIHPEDNEKLIPLLAQYVTASSQDYLLKRGRGPTESLLYRIKDALGEWRYLESTGDLLEDNHVLFVSRDVTGKIEAEQDLKNAHEKLEEKVKERTGELETQRKSLEEMNVALKVLLETRERERKELEEKVLFSVRELADPYLQKLKNSGLNEVQKTWLDILESSLQEVTSPLLADVMGKGQSLTPSEIQVVNLIRLGRTSKEIAGTLGLSTKTVETHRRNIRKKLGLKKTNLRSYLLQYQNP